MSIADNNLLTRTITTTSGGDDWEYIVRGTTDYRIQSKNKITEEDKVFTKKVTITSAQILAGNNVTNIIGNPGAGKIIAVSDVIGRIDFNTTAYSAATINIDTNPSSRDRANSPNLLTATEDRISFFNIVGDSTGTQILNDNASIRCKFSVAPTGGDSDLILYITYKVITM
jgi:hypothetical protein